MQPDRLKDEVIDRHAPNQVFKAATPAIPEMEFEVLAKDLIHAKAKAILYWMENVKLTINRETKIT